MTCYGPKCLLKYRDKTILENQIEVIKTFDCMADIIVVVGFESRKIAAINDPRIRIVENPQFEDTGAAESLRLGLLASIPSNVYVIHGDIIFSHATLTFPDKDMAGLSVDSHDRIDQTEVGVGVTEDLVVNLSYGLPLKWGQIAYLPQSHFPVLRKVCGQTDGAKSTFEVVNELIKKKIKFVTYENSRSILKEIDSIKDL
jgi:choline kinase